MYLIKKSTFFYLNSLILQNILVSRGFLAFFDGFDFSFTKRKSFFLLVSFYKFNCFFLSASFISFFIKRTGLLFFFFFKPSVFLLHGFVLSDFFNFLKESSNFFLIGFSFNYSFFNDFWFYKMSNFSFSFSFFFVFFYLSLFFNLYVFFSFFFFLVFFFQKKLSSYLLF